MEHHNNKNILLHEHKNGDKEWYDNGKRHREDGPAIDWIDGHKEWYRNGKLHREDGPAVEWLNGYKGWWVGMSGIDSPRLTTTFGIPEFIQEFIQDFDNHRYPDLIDPDLDENGYQNGCPCDYCMPNIDGAKE